MCQDNTKFFIRRAASDRRKERQIAPPYLSMEGMVLIDRRITTRRNFTQYDGYAFCAWVEANPYRMTPWSAWYEIHSLDCKTLIAGPFELPHEFASPEEASVEAQRSARTEIRKRNLAPSDAGK